MPVNRLGSITDAGAAAQGDCCGGAPTGSGNAAANRCCQTSSASCCEPASDCCDGVQVDPDEEGVGGAQTLPAFVNPATNPGSSADVPLWFPIESEEERRRRLQAQQLV